MDLILPSGIRERARDFARKIVAPSIERRERDGRIDRQLWNQMGGEGLLGKHSKDDNRFLEGLQTCLMLEGFGEGAPDPGLFASWAAHTLRCTLPIRFHGTGAQKEAYLPGLTAGTLVGAASLSGSSAFDVRDVPIHAIRTEGGWVLNGTTSWVANLPDADVLLVAAVTSEPKAPIEFSVFLVDLPASGIQIGPRIEQAQLRTMSVATCTFSDCQLPQKSMLGLTGNGLDIVRTILRWDWGLAMVPWLGVMESLLAHCTQVAKSVNTFGRPLAESQLIRRKLVDMDIQIELAQGMAYRAGSGLDDRLQGATDMAAASIFLAESAQESVRAAVEICANDARMSGSWVERLSRDSAIFVLEDHPRSILKTVVASSFIDLTDKWRSAREP
jgi:isovaleryl-CoA dehydrogenase